MADKQLTFTLFVIIVFLVSAGLIATLGDGLQKWDDQYSYPPILRITDVDISADALSEGEALLTIITYIDNHGGPSENVSVLVKAFDSDTNLLTVENKTKVLGISSDERTSITRTKLKVPKEGGYKLEIVLFDGNKSVQSGNVQIQRLSMLEPPSYAKVSIREIDFSVKGEKDNRVTVKTTLYIDNIGKDDTTGLHAFVKARDLSTRLIVDESWIDLGTLKHDATTTKTIDLNVINERNYNVEVQIWLGQKIVKQASSQVNLEPFANKTEVISGSEVTVVTTSSGAKVGDFTSSEESRYQGEYPADGSAEYGMGQPEGAPGFEGIFAMLSIIIVSVFLLRKRRER